MLVHCTRNCFYAAMATISGASLSDTYHLFLERVLVSSMNILRSSGRKTSPGLGVDFI